MISVKQKAIDDEPRQFIHAKNSFEPRSSENRFSFNRLVLPDYMSSLERLMEEQLKDKFLDTRSLNYLRNAIEL